MPHQPDVPTNELRRLYEVEGLTVREIGKRVGMSGQAVHFRLQNVGVEFRPNKVRPRKLDGELLKRLYMVEKLSIERIAAHLRTTRHTVSTALRENGIEVRKRGDSTRRYQALATLKIGESITVPRPTSRGKWYGRFHKSAKAYGVGVSIRTVDDSTVEIRRVA